MELFVIRKGIIAYCENNIYKENEIRNLFSWIEAERGPYQTLVNKKRMYLCDINISNPKRPRYEMKTKNFFALTEQVTFLLWSLTDLYPPQMLCPEATLKTLRKDQYPLPVSFVATGLAHYFQQP